MDPTVQRLLIDHGTIFVIGIALLIGLWYFITSTLVPYFKTRTGHFPFVSTLLMAALVLVYGYYVSYTLSHQRTDTIEDTLTEQREAELRKQDADYKPPQYTPAGDTLQRKTEEMERKNREDNAAAKKRFTDEVPAVK